VRVQLEGAGGMVTLRISDDGCGLSPAPANPRGLGLIGMRARARSAGGDVAIRSRAGQGVLIEVRVPVGDETHSNSVS
jgi:signal transduction histidine kinase